MREVGVNVRRVEGGFVLDIYTPFDDTNITASNNRTVVVQTLDEVKVKLDETFPANQAS